jgi:hypothetical protein
MPLNVSLGDKVRLDRFNRREIAINYLQDRIDRSPGRVGTILEPALKALYPNTTPMQPPVVDAGEPYRSEYVYVMRDVSIPDLNAAGITIMEIICKLGWTESMYVKGDEIRVAGLAYCGSHSYSYDEKDRDLTKDDRALLAAWSLLSGKAVEDLRLQR